MRCFAAVAEAGSFAAAARKLDLSPAVVTKRVQRLEQHIGARLFNRDTRHVGLTEAGTLYLERCRDVLEAIEHAEAEASELGRLPRGRLSITAPYDFGPAEIEPAVLDFIAEYPEISVDLLLTSEFVDLVKDDYDMAVRIAGRPLDPTLIARRLATSRLVVCGSPDYFDGRPPRVPADLERHNCLVYTGAVWREEWPFTLDGRTEKVALTGSLRTNDNLLLCRAAEAGIGLTIQPSFNVWRELCSGRLQVVLEDWHIDELGVHVVFPHRRYLPSKVRVFVDFLTARFRNSPDRDIWLDRARFQPGRACESVRT
jgi:DNA-binding transcriptional LysR family regulator